MTQTSSNIDNATALNTVFSDSSNFLIIGLTGRTGSGCSTSANILCSQSLSLPDVEDSHFSGNERKKYKIIKNYINISWNPFKWLQVRSIITRYILELNFSEFTLLISKTTEKKLSAIRKELKDFEEEYIEAHNKIVRYLETDDDDKKHEAYDLYFNWLPKFSDIMRDTLKQITIGAYTKTYQQVGDNIRASGSANTSKFNPDKIFSFANTINKVIKSAHRHCRKIEEPCHIVIDAIRNPYESAFFKERFANYYQISINTKNENRLKHLQDSHKFTDQQIHNLDQKEYPEKLIGYKKYTSQNIQKCIEVSDIHINNPKKSKFGNSDLSSQLAWYVSLMLHPGLVMPTSMESCMQIAYSVKKNSGCISRQVGAVMTDDGYSVKSVGWNNTPQEQVPCLLRSAPDLLDGINVNIYSDYENNDPSFREVIKFKYDSARAAAESNGRNLSYCFKDVHNEITHDKNQVHTRALHAEENAMLQISKFGGQMLKGGILFTTASPCELCAKKAYQLGITKIYYIDPYPGISTSHVLAQGESAPKLILFRGAVGTAFHRLYQPALPFKEELEVLLNIPKKENNKDTEIRRLKEEVRNLKNKIEELDS